jgi:hypothetical protein
MMCCPSSIPSNYTASPDQLPAHRFLTDDGGNFGLLGGSTFNIDLLGGTGSSGFEPLVSGSGSEIVLDDHLGGSCFHARMDNSVYYHPSSQPGGSGAGLSGSHFMPEWTIISMIILPPNVEILAPFLVVPAFMPEWTIISTIILPPNTEVLVMVLAVPAIMPE